MVMIEGLDISCGVLQVFGVESQRPETVINAVYDEHIMITYEYADWGGGYSEKDLPAFFVFSDIHEPTLVTGGQALADYIKKHKLGPVSQSTIRRNTNSGNRIRVWTWGPNATAIRAWHKMQQEEKEKNKNERKSRTRGNSRGKLAGLPRS